jgi:Fe-S-cluster containining protein
LPTGRRRETQLNDRMEIDTEELKGKVFRCIEGCALCCLCQPELLPSEAVQFLSIDRLKGSVTRSSIDPSRRAIAMFGSGGPCKLLRERKCTAYSLRPHFCRIFPVHTHLMWRIQLTADLSCRGVWREDWKEKKGEYEDLESYGLRELHTYAREKLESELRESAEVYSEFRENCIDAGIWMEPSGLRENASRLISQGYLSSLSGIGKILSAVDTCRNSDLDFRTSLSLAGGTGAEASVSSALEELADEMLSIDSVADRPVFIDRELNWLVFGYDSGHIAKFRLGDKGGISRIGTSDISLKTISVGPSGARSLSEFAGLTNRRDVFLGFVYYIVDDAGYEDSVENIYFENLAMTQLDLLFRSSLVNPSAGRSLEAEQISDGIVFIDMDMHDAPTIGSVI